MDYSRLQIVLCLLCASVFEVLYPLRAAGTVNWLSPLTHNTKKQSLLDTAVCRHVPSVVFLFKPEMLGYTYCSDCDTSDGNVGLLVPAAVALLYDQYAGGYKKAPVTIHVVEKLTVIYQVFWFMTTYLHN